MFQNLQNQKRAQMQNQKFTQLYHKLKIYFINKIMSDENTEHPAKKQQDGQIKNMEIGQTPQIVSAQNSPQNESSLVFLQIQRQTVDKNFQEDIMAIYNNIGKRQLKIQGQRKKSIKEKTPKKQLKKEVKQLKYEEKCEMTILKQFSQVQKEELLQIIKGYQIHSKCVGSDLNSFRQKRKLYLFKNIVFGVYQLLQPKNTSYIQQHQKQFLENTKKNLQSFAKLLANKFDAIFLKVCNQNDNRNTSRKYLNQWDIFEKNIMDPQNIDLRKKIICGDLTPEYVASMPQDQMYSSARLKRISETKKRLLREFEKPQNQTSHKEEEQVQIGYGVTQSTVSEIKKNIFPKHTSLVIPKYINLQAKALDLQQILQSIKKKWKQSYDQLKQPEKVMLQIHFEKNVQN